jgi:hypothetical protein
MFNASKERISRREKMEVMQSLVVYKKINMDLKVGRKS